MVTVTYSGMVGRFEISRNGHQVSVMANGILEYGRRFINTLDSMNFICLLLNMSEPEIDTFIESQAI